MSLTIAMSGNDTLIINNYLFTGEADGTVVDLTFPNEVAQVKTGKNGNTIYGFNQTGIQCEMKIRSIRGSGDDKFMLQLLNLMLQNFSGFPLMIGTFVKMIGDGKGNISRDTYILSGGIFMKQPEAKSNVEGDTEQSVTIWPLKFGNVSRTIT